MLIDYENKKREIYFKQLKQLFGGRRFYVGTAKESMPVSCGVCDTPYEEVMGIRTVYGIENFQVQTCDCGED